MARKKVGLKIRPDSIEENESILREIRAQNKVDDRSPKNLKELFTTLNANNSLKDVKNKNFVAFKNTHETKGTYGPIPGCPSGTWWGIRVDCSRAGVHRPFNLDIHDGPFGAISICTPQLSESKDVDFGDFLTLTGREYFEGNSENESLVLNYGDCVPLRVVRSYSLSNEYSPKTGYRYDGLYYVIAHWIGESKNSVKHHKFVLKRLLNQEPAPWHQLNAKSSLKPQDERAKYLPKRLACSLRKRSPKLKPQSVSSTDSEKHNSDKFNQKLCESFSVSQNGSAILTRQIFKKPNACSETIAPDSQSSQTEPTLRKSYFCKKLGQSQLQNTNIAVRTDLYDSFHNVQQEAKRCAPMTFCRIFKPSQLAKPVVESPSGEKRISNEDPPADWSEVNNSIFQKKNIEDEKITNAATNSGKEAEAQRQDSISPEAISRIVGYPVSNETNEINFDRRDSDSPDQQDNDRSEKCQSTPNCTSSDSSNSLDALTPDKILNLVVKEKRNPMAKLLIGNVIGLSIEESKVIRAYNALISKENKVSENVNRQSEKRLKTASNFKMISKRILRHNKNDENRKNYSKLAKRNRGCIDAGQESSANPKFNDDPGGAIVYSRSGKRKNITDDSKMKKSPGCKKQRREIANLVIDAKVGPIIRGPRNRRLRCQSHKRMEKEHDGFIGNSAFPRRRGMLTKQAKRSELSKRRKRLKGGITKPRKLQPGNINLNLVRGKRNKALEVSRNFQEMLTRTSDVQKTTMVQTTKKSRMVDAVAQCSLLSEPSINFCQQVNPEPEPSTDPLYNVDRSSVVKIEEVNLDEIKSEDNGEFSEEESVGSRECLNIHKRLRNGSVEPVYNVYPLIHRESAFVPVNSSSSLKIARLRSIGFRPIQIEADGDFTDNISRISNDRENSDNVIRKDADEEFIKYTNDENNIVGYMDDDLHYEDIENEDRSIINERTFRVATPIEYTEVNTPCSLRSMDSNLNQGLEDNLDRPWHGWRKVSSKKGDEWIGW